MHPSADPLLLITRKLTESQMARLRAAAPDARVAGEEELAARPGLISRVDICHPSLPAGLWTASP